jgi:transposase-like protein
LRALEALSTYFFNWGKTMKLTLRLHCPNGRKTVERDFKLIRYYGPHRTPYYRCRRCGHEFSARHNSVFAGFHTDEETIYRVLKALAEGNGIRACARIFDIIELSLH